MLSIKAAGYASGRQQKKAVFIRIKGYSLKKEQSPAPWVE
jgi:hypothetical protein